jgi:pimeloyl-ACP methyl ester carboxylesterase
MDRGNGGKIPSLREVARKSIKRFGMSDDVRLLTVGQHETAIADIVFVHGLGGDAQATWKVDPKRDDTFWPKWVYDDFRDSNTPCTVWTLAYPAAATGWTNRGGAMALPDRATNVLEYLVNNKIGERPIIFVSHSLGGVLTKYILRMGSESKNGAYRQLAQQTHSVVFMATPHRGSNLASILRGLQVALPTAAIDDLRADSAYLNQIDMWYRDNVDKLDVRTFAVRENRKLGSKLLWVVPGPPFWVVDPTSADPNIPGRPVIPIDANHFEICKPDSRDAPAYTNVKAFLRQSLADLRTAMRATNQELVTFLAGIAKEDDRCLCVLSSFENSLTTYKTTSGESRRFLGTTVSPEDTAAAVYLCGLVSRVRNFSMLSVKPTGSVSDDEQENHLLLVGSSITNRQTRWALSREDARYRFVLGQDIGFRIECRACKNNNENRRWLPNDGDRNLNVEYTPGQATSIDYAMVQRLKWKQFDIFVLAGLGPVGTKGAAYFMNENWCRLYRTYGDQPFGVVLRFGTDQQTAVFNDPTVVHRTDPDHKEHCIDKPLD